MTTKRMSEPDFDTLLTAWFEADARVREPETLVDDALVRVQRSRRLPPGSSLNGGSRCNTRCTLRAVPTARHGRSWLIVLLAGRHRGDRRRRLHAATPGSVRTGGQRTGRVPVERPDLRREPGRLEPDPADLRRSDRRPRRLVPRRDQGRLQADRPNAAGRTTRRARRSSSSPTPTARTRSRSTATPKDLSPASWSPDGRWLVYSQLVDGTDQIFIAAADGSSPPVRIGNPETVNWSPIFSPDGTKIAVFRGSDGDGIGGHEPRTVRTSRSSTRLHSSTIDSATWHPDGNRIVVCGCRRTEATDLWFLYARRVTGTAPPVPDGPRSGPAGPRTATDSPTSPPLDGLSFTPPRRRRRRRQRAPAARRLRRHQSHLVARRHG